MYSNFKHRSSANSRFTVAESFFRVTRSSSCSGWYRHGTTFFTPVEKDGELSSQPKAKAADAAVVPS